MKIDHVIRKALETGASDIHLVTGLPPSLRVAGEIIVADGETLGPDSVWAMVSELLNEEQRKEFERHRRICFSTIFKDSAHVRVSLYSRLGRVEAALRLRSLELRGMEELDLPEAVAELTRAPNGLVLITGPTGVGKTTTLYSMIDLINRERRKKIITVEDPIEYIHSHKRSMVIQQEIGKDVSTYHEALMHILRLDPDVICIGEIRDGDTVAAALLAAETGHLVIATLHTTSAVQTMERIITAIPTDRRSGAQVQLANCLRGVISQQLLPTLDRKSRALAYEVMIANNAVKRNIREGNLNGLNVAIQGGRADGMISLDSRLRELYEGARISYETAVTYAHEPKIISDHKKSNKNHDSPAAS